MFDKTKKMIWKQRLSFIVTSILAGIAIFIFGDSLKYIAPNPDAYMNLGIPFHYYISPVVSGLIFFLTWTLSGSRRFPFLIEGCAFLILWTPVVTALLLYYEYNVVYRNCFGLAGVNEYAQPFCVNPRFPDVLEPNEAWILYVKGCVFNLMASAVAVFHAATYKLKEREEEPVNEQKPEDEPTKEQETLKVEQKVNE